MRASSVAKDLGISCGLKLYLDASATMCLVNRRGLGKAKHVDMQNRWIQPVHHEESRHEAEDRTAHGHHGLRVYGG